MTRSWALNDLLATLFDRRLRPAVVQSQQRSLAEICGALLSEQGEVSGMMIAADLLARLDKGGADERLAFFRLLAEGFDIDPQTVQVAASDYAAALDTKSLARLLQASEPRRQELLRRLNQAPGATAALVKLRTELMRSARKEPGLGRVDLDFHHLLSSWFNRGFLVLKRISWDSPATVLERIIAYEAVHEINDWADLRARVQPEDRRCFAFFHPAMPDDPLIFVEVALTQGIPAAIGPILSQTRETLAVERADTAVFYSISNCQAGLRGISFGNSLIKQVVAVLRQEMPHLTTFVTLSPLPGLAAWIKAEGLVPDQPASLPQLAARYLTQAKTEDAQPLDPVARFHLGNGATLHDIHADADLSPRGKTQSHGVMVNYLYDPRQTEQNHEAFAKSGTISASQGVKTLAKPVPTATNKGNS